MNTGSNTLPQGTTGARQPREARAAAHAPVKPAMRAAVTTRVFATALTALLLSGCTTGYFAEPVPEWREPLGEAFHAQREGQRLNPAPVESEPVTGLDGQAAERSMKVYRQGEEKKEEANTVNFKFGNPKSGKK